MRDLARGEFVSHRSSKSKAIIRVFLILVVVLGVVAFFRVLNIGSGRAGSSVILQEAPRGLTPISLDNSQNVAEGGVDLATQKAQLVDVKYGGEAGGVATRSFGGGTYILSVDATLPDPKGNSYGVWLQSGDEVILIDYMSGSKNSWSFRLRGPDKFSGYREIWITLERSKDQKPEEHVLEGSW